MLRVKATGIERSERRLRLLAGRVGDLAPANRLIGREFTREERALFSGHRGLAPLKGSTIERKLRDRDGHVRANATSPLEATGHLRDFLEGPSQPIHVTRSSVTLGIPEGRRDLDYAQVQARHGRSPVVAARTLGRASVGIIRDYLLRPL
jgi:hypothetical protein